MIHSSEANKDTAILNNNEERRGLNYSGRVFRLGVLLETFGVVVCLTTFVWQCVEDSSCQAEFRRCSSNLHSTTLLLSPQHQLLISSTNQPHSIITDNQPSLQTINRQHQLVLYLFISPLRYHPALKNRLVPLRQSPWRVHPAPIPPARIRPSRTSTTSESVQTAVPSSLSLS